MSEDTKQPTLVDLEQEAITVRTEMSAVKITDQATYDEAVTMLTKASGWLKNAREFFKGMKDPAHAAWKKICSNENLVCDPTENGIKQIKAEIVRYDAEQERIRLAEQARLEEEARRRAQSDRIAEAEVMEAQGHDAETIDAVLDAPVVVQTSVVAERTYERSSDVVYRDNWSGEVTDLLALVKYVSKNKQHINLIQINQPSLTQLARALKGAMDIPGIKAVNNKVIASSGR